jgi:hypothetical protein
MKKTHHFQIKVRERASEFQNSQGFVTNIDIFNKLQVTFSFNVSFQVD